MDKRTPPFQPDTAYHLYGHAVGSENLFRETDNYRYFLERFSFHTSSILEMYAYCCMPNHFHIVVQLRPEITIRKHFTKRKPSAVSDTKDVLSRKMGQTFGNWLNAYTSAYNIRYRRRGRLFVESLNRNPIRNSDQLLNTIHYVHYNPVYHGFVANPEDWPHSSYPGLSKESSSVQASDKVYLLFGGPDAFFKRHLDPPDPRLFVQLDKYG